MDNEVDLETSEEEMTRRQKLKNEFAEFRHVDGNSEYFAMLALLRHHRRDLGLPDTALTRIYNTFQTKFAEKHWCVRKNLARRTWCIKPQGLATYVDWISNDRNLLQVLKVGRFEDYLNRRKRKAELANHVIDFTPVEAVKRSEPVQPVDVDTWPQAPDDLAVLRQEVQNLQSEISELRSKATTADQIKTEILEELRGSSALRTREQVQTIMETLRFLENDGKRQFQA